MSKHDKVPEKILFPNLFNKEFSSINKKNQRRIVALALIGMKRERDRLYEELDCGKKQTLQMSEDEKSMHYRNFMPPVNDDGRYQDVNTTLHFSNKFLCEFTGLKEISLYNGVKNGCEAIMSKVISYSDDKKKEFIKFVPIYQASYSKDQGCKLTIADSAVFHFMNHARGFSEVSLKTWAELNNTHSMRLLQALSGFKGSNMSMKWTLDTFRSFMGVKQKQWESFDEINAADSNVYDTEAVMVGEPKYFLNGKPDMPYTKMPDLVRRVISPAFSDLIKVSDGVWTATDKDGLGYELIKTGRQYTHIKICLKHNKHGDKAKKPKVTRDQAKAQFGQALWEKTKSTLYPDIDNFEELSQAEKLEAFKSAMAEAGIDINELTKKD